ncbi:MAG: FG-GAP-like repeat-containing protein [Bryobacteraceae bacterium]
MYCQLTRRSHWRGHLPGIGIFLFLMAGAASAGELKPPRVFGAGSFPYGIAVGDFNEDGKLDLAVANSNLLSQQASSLGVFLGNGDGTFQPMVSYQVGRTPRAVVAGDFNGDGHLDLAVANQDGFVSVLLGDGRGNFQNAVDFAAGPSPLSIAEGDFNGDGHLDLAVANFVEKATPGQVSVLIGNGDGTFRPPVQFVAGVVPQAIAVGDVNGDGRPDLVVANDGYGNIPGKVGVLLGQGDGTFGPVQEYSAGVNPFSIALGDFNGDGNLDVVVTDETQLRVEVLLNNGKGGFNAAVPYSTGQNPFSVAVGDVNGDGALDLVVANMADGTVSVLLGTGNGTFETGTAYNTGLGVATSVSPQAVALGDFNGDRHPDVAVANATLPRGTVSLLLNTGSVALLVSPTVLSYVSTGVGTSSPPATVTIRNNTKVSLPIAAIAVAGMDRSDFLESDTCSSSLAPQATCAISVTFHPMQNGDRTAILVIGDGAPDSPQEVLLRGSGQ